MIATHSQPDDHDHACLNCLTAQLLEAIKDHAVPLPLPATAAVRDQAEQGEGGERKRGRFGDKVTVQLYRK